MTSAILLSLVRPEPCSLRLWYAYHTCPLSSTQKASICFVHPHRKDFDAGWLMAEESTERIHTKRMKITTKKNI